eukprot:COSAG02_NODE_606_length_19624_cov_33.479846_12_plen_212_part_00
MGGGGLEASIGVREEWHLAKAELLAPRMQIATTEMTKLMGAQWRALTAKQKEPFEKQAAQDKVRYQQEFERWVAEHPEEVEMVAAAKKEKKQGKKRSMKQEGGPKRACTAYIFFTNSVREETQQEAPDAKVTQPHPLTRRSSDQNKQPCVASVPPAWPPSPPAGLPEALPPADRACALARTDDGLEQVDGSQVAGPLGIGKSSVCGEGERG